MTEREPELEVIEAEIVGAPGFEPESKVSWAQKIKGRFIASLALGAAGLFLCVLGVLFSLSLIGILIGLPLLAAGVGLILASIFVFIAGGKAHTVTVRFPNSSCN